MKFDIRGLHATKIINLYSKLSFEIEMHAFGKVLDRVFIIILLLHNILIYFSVQLQAQQK